MRRTHLEAGNVKTAPLFLPPSSERERWADVRGHIDRPLQMGWCRNQIDEGAKAVSLFVRANRLLAEICTPVPRQLVEVEKVAEVGLEESHKRISSLFTAFMSHFNNQNIRQY